MQIAPPRTAAIPADRLRPGRHWYVTAGLIAAGLTALGAVLGILRFQHLLDAVGDGPRFGNDRTVTLRLEPGDDRAIWAMYPGRSPGPTCTISGPGHPALHDGSDLTLTRDETWYLLYRVDVQRAGAYDITCSSQALSRYTVGDAVGFFGFAATLVVAILLPVLGIVLCVVIVLVTTLRRNAHRTRLLAEQHRIQGGSTA
ncbi:hypothetical protein GTW43_14180 [Streptomyces sp. SID5785]|uniref:hypothetical protein n=1 Tax=Streptomyces sp. SID5785 TaxID=2690309 RepID=UPI0013615AAF|nr:hypothetical protein [Streptomyces sp. SID5785]MZD05084.1 hypothetical protein [Streptomyces sp. SID5785]MZD06230.1 hypothetical protein [Streptomyces sp. SID5785]